MNLKAKLRRWSTFPNLVAGALLLASTPFMYWAIVDRQPAASSVSEIVSSEVMQGGYLQIDYDVVWRADCEITAFRYIIDGLSVEWPVSPQYRIVQEGRQKFQIQVPVPIAAAPGPATYKGTIRYVCNPVQRLFPLEQDLREREFTIIANPDFAWTKQGSFFKPQKRYAQIEDYSD